MRRKRTAWSFFPWYITAAMCLVIAVNGYMAYAALSTFPGDAGGDGFELSNHYNAILDRMQREEALGWGLRADVDAAGHPTMALTDRSGAALAGAAIEATARRPLGDPRTTVVRFTETSPGHYATTAVLDEKGQWELEFSATAGGREFRTTRRIVVR